MKTIIPDSPPTVVSAAPKQISRWKRFGCRLGKFASLINPFRDKSREVQETYVQR